MSKSTQDALVMEIRYSKQEEDDYDEEDIKNENIPKTFLGRMVKRLSGVIHKPLQEENKVDLNEAIC